MNWTMLLAIVSTAGLTSGLFSFITKSIIRTELDGFKEKLNGTYIRRTECGLLMENLKLKVKSEGDPT